MHYNKTNTRTTTTTTTKQPEKMASATPIAIGTRGTVGALVRKEIEYFTKLELDRRARPRGGPSHHGGHNHHHHHLPNWHSLRFLVMTWKKKKHSHRASASATARSFLPALCSVSDVSDVNRLNGVPGFGYRALRDDVDYNLEL